MMSTHAGHLHRAANVMWLYVVCCLLRTFFKRHLWLDTLSSLFGVLPHQVVVVMVVVWCGVGNLRGGRRCYRSNSSAIALVKAGTTLAACSLSLPKAVAASFRTMLSPIVFQILTEY